MVWMLGTGWVLSFRPGRKAASARRMRRMRKFQNWIVGSCLIVVGIFVVRLIWLSPDKDSPAWEKTLLEGAICGAIFLWFAERFRYFRLLGLVAGSVGAAWVGYENWTSGRHAAAPLYIMLCGIFLYNLIRLGVDILRNRAADPSVPQSNE